MAISARAEKSPNLSKGTISQGLSFLEILGGFNPYHARHKQPLKSVNAEFSASKAAQVAAF